VVLRVFPYILNYLLTSEHGKWHTFPVGRSAGGVALEEGASESHGDIKGSVPIDVLVPSVPFQGDEPYRATLGAVGALRFAGYKEHADSLVKEAEEVLSCSTNQTACVVELLS